MAAFVLGYDVAARLCGAFTPWPLAHQNGQACLLAAVAAGARLRGLDAAGISRAMRIGVTLMMTPSYTNVVAGATALNVAGGMSGFAAALAPELAAAGFEAQADAIEEGLSNLVGSGFKPDGTTGRPWHHLAHHAELFSAVCVLQSHSSGAGCAGGGAGGSASTGRAKSIGLTSKHMRLHR